MSQNLGILGCAPHFEKMLYDNAQLARVYVHAWQLTGRPLFRAIAEETLDFVLREMTDPAGGFYASLDADSEGEEGRYYTWTMEELKETLGDDATEFIKRYAPRHEDDLHGRAVLAYVGDEADRPQTRALCERLHRARQRRERPARDDKVLASWNGLMLAALADAGRAFARDDYTRAARRSAAFLLEALRTPEGRLLRVWKAGVARLNGYLEDYAHLVEGLLALYQATFETHWFRAARDLAEQILTHFGSDTLLYDTSDDHEELVVRPRELEDNAIPSGNAMAATVLLRLADLTLEARYGELAHRMLAQAESLASSHPLGFAQWLIAADYVLSPHLTLAIVGDPADERTASLLEVWEEGYHPHGVVAVGGASSTEEDVVPLLAGRRQADGRPTAYLCGQASCQTPTTEPSVLRELIAAGRGRQLAAH